MTIVLATEIRMPTTSPWLGGHPRAQPAASPRPIDTRMPSGAPSRATRRTWSRSRRENSSPIENIRRTTPISANSSNV